MKIIFHPGEFLLIFNIMKYLRTAMVLAAGYGSRMRDLSRHLPKPLLPLHSKYRLIDVILHKLRHQGFRRVVVNVHYQGQQIMEYVGNGERYGLQIFFSVEEQLMGTGGGIALAERFFEGETILTANVDVLSTIDFRDFYQAFLEKKPLAAMAVYPAQSPQPYRLVTYNEAHRLTGFLPSGKLAPSTVPTAIFMGYAILTAEARRYLSPEPQSVVEALYIPAIRDGHTIAVYPFTGQWMDVGTQEFYIALKKELELGRITLDSFLN